MEQKSHPVKRSVTHLQLGCPGNKPQGDQQHEHFKEALVYKPGGRVKSPAQGAGSSRGWCSSGRAEVKEWHYPASPKEFSSKPCSLSPVGSECFSKINQKLNEWGLLKTVCLLVIAQLLQAQHSASFPVQTSRQQQDHQQEEQQDFLICRLPLSMPVHTGIAHSGIVHSPEIKK